VVDARKKKRLEAAGWRVGTVAEFLELSDAESALVEMRLSLARALKVQRAKRGVTQTSLARALRSSQSRVAKMESGDPSVSLDLIVRALLIVGASSRDVASAMVKRVA
jgi:ribosome-binding protein aMBF1 (putative translation factor)